jgi:hypothetical protein
LKFPVAGRLDGLENMPASKLSGIAGRRNQIFPGVAL